MSFVPRYTITDKLLANIKRISVLVAELNNRRFPRIVLMEFEKEARAVSAHASTSIEGNPLPLTEVKRILKSTPAHIRESEKEIINYNQALLNLNTYLETGNVSLSLELIFQLQSSVTVELLPRYETGYLRKKAVVVNNPKTGMVVYLPPEADDVKRLMTDLIRFIKENRAHTDPLILAGIFHKQMVIIHPFMDGNGRTARLATKILLADMGILNTFNLFSFENYYNKNITGYFQSVGESGKYYDLEKNIDFSGWLEYFTEGIVDELLRVQKLLPKAAYTPETRLESHHQKILKHLAEKGYINDKDYTRLTNRAKATRTLDFKKLIRLGLIERKGKGRATYYILTPA